MPVATVMRGLFQGLQVLKVFLVFRQHQT